ncbi:carbohydrate kinase [Arcanobacterium haemolyticum]|nr:carbohydrate kinase [Arcanobacterium haemolyticum]
MTHYILGIDNGGSVSKAAIYDDEGTMVAFASHNIPQPHAIAGWSERNMNQLWEANVAAIRDVLLTSKLNGNQISAITVTGHGNGLYLVDNEGNPVRNGIVSNDSRALEYVERWAADGSYLKNCLHSTMQSAFAGGPLPIMMWLQDHEPEAVSRTRYVFMVKDYIRFKLTGKPGLEVTDASCTNLLDITTKTIARDALTAMGAEVWLDKFPPIVDSNDIVGTVTPDVAALTGLSPTTPAYGGISDISASSIGVGGVDDYAITLVTGTWSINNFFSPQPIVDKDLFITSIAPIPERYLITEGSPTSAANLEWFVNNVLRKLPAYSATPHSELYDLCNRLAFADGRPQGKVSFYPYIFKSPLHPRVLGGWMNFTNADGIGNLLSAMYEGVAFSAREHVERLQSFGKHHPVARITGGVAKCPEWTQLFADVLGLKLTTVPVAETGILGAVMVAMTAQGVFSSIHEASEVMVPSGATFEPSRHPAIDYDERYHEWRDEIQNME